MKMIIHIRNVMILVVHVKLLVIQVIINVLHVLLIITLFTLHQDNVIQKIKNVIDAI